MTRIVGDLWLLLACVLAVPVLLYGVAFIVWHLDHLIRLAYP